MAPFLDYLFLAKNLERVAVQETNIATDVVDGRDCPLPAADAAFKVAPAIVHNRRRETPIYRQTPLQRIAPKALRGLLGDHPG